MFTERSAPRASLPLMKYGEMLRRAREKAGKSLRQTGDAVKLSVSYMHRVEHSTTPPLSTQHTLDLARFFGTDPIPLIMAMQNERREVRLPIHEDTLERRQFAALLEMRWVDRELDRKTVKALLQCLEGAKKK